MSNACLAHSPCGPVCLSVPPSTCASITHPSSIILPSSVIHPSIHPSTIHHPFIIHHPSFIHPPSIVHHSSILHPSSIHHSSSIIHHQSIHPSIIHPHIVYHPSNEGETHQFTSLLKAVTWPPKLLTMKPSPSSQLQGPTSSHLSLLLGSLLQPHWSESLVSPSLFPLLACTCCSLCLDLHLACSLSSPGHCLGNFCCVNKPSHNLVHENNKHFLFPV